MFLQWNYGSLVSPDGAIHKASWPYSISNSPPYPPAGLQPSMFQLTSFSHQNFFQMTPYQHAILHWNPKRNEMLKFASKDDCPLSWNSFLAIVTCWIWHISKLFKTYPLLQVFSFNSLSFFLLVCEVYELQRQKNCAVEIDDISTISLKSIKILYLNDLWSDSS